MCEEESEHDKWINEDDFDEIVAYEVADEDNTNIDENGMLIEYGMRAFKQRF